MADVNEFKSALFQTNPNLIVKRSGEECHALLYNMDKDIFVCKGLQSELIYWLSQRFTVFSFEEVSSAMKAIYDIDEQTLYADLAMSLRSLIEKRLIILKD